jgi:hypothetical protein
LRKKRYGIGTIPWFDLAMLGLEAQQVVWLRLMKLSAGGPDANRESIKMVSEKMTASIEAGRALMLGGSPKSVVQGYRRKVRSNARRLSK